MTEETTDKFMMLTEQIYHEFEHNKEIDKRSKPETIKAIISHTTGECSNWAEAARIWNAQYDTLMKAKNAKSGKKIIKLTEEYLFGDAPKRAMKKIIRLSEYSESDAVAMRASERIRDEAGHKPTEKRQIQHSGTVHVGLPTVIMDPRQLSDEQIEKLFGPQDVVVEGECAEVNVAK